MIDKRFLKLAFGLTDSYIPIDNGNPRGLDDIAIAARYNPAVAVSTIIQDSSMDPVQKAVGFMLVDKANKESEGPGFHTYDLIRAGIYSGLGYGVAAATGKVLGAVFSLSPEKQKTLARAGAIGGLLTASGLWK